MGVAPHVSVEVAPAAEGQWTTVGMPPAAGVATRKSMPLGSPAAPATVAVKPAAVGVSAVTRCLDMGTALPASPKSHQPLSSGTTV